MKSILEFIEKNAAERATKTAFADICSSVTYSELFSISKSIGSYIAGFGWRNSPVAIFLDKTVAVPEAMFGIVYSGNFYTVIDNEMPAERIEKIFSRLEPVCIITDEKNRGAAEKLNCGKIILIEECREAPIDDRLLSSARDLQIDTDPLYVLFTSGSTGVPKGAVITHRNVIAYSEWFCSAFGVDETTVFGNQTPFCFSMSVSDIYATVRTGATLNIIPKMYFSFPVKLIEFLNERKVNTIYWVPSALSIVANFKALDEDKPRYLKKVLFAGEAMPVKQLNYWRGSLPEDVVYCNLFGPTETTDICTYYVVDRSFSEDESLPIGRHCDNCSVFVLNSEGSPVKEGESGELFAGGSFVSPGYYNDPEKTALSFVQNPCNKAYPETVYKTGDIVKLNERGEYVYLSRRDFQIKHMGYRIELGEIEASAGAVKGITECACIYDDVSDRIILFWCGRKITEDGIMADLGSKLPAYLLPSKLIKLKNIPRNSNGKTDRVYLKNMITEDEKNG